ncbi:hypothetical protein H0X32_04315 [Patescibacteria group bacterium]|nr:hypothetical protein [Patescibacteria group bacterium]
MKIRLEITNELRITEQKGTQRRREYVDIYPNIHEEMRQLLTDAWQAGREGLTLEEFYLMLEE